MVYIYTTVDRSAKGQRVGRISRTSHQDIQVYKEEDGVSYFSAEACARYTHVSSCYTNSAAWGYECWAVLCRTTDQKLPAVRPIRQLLPLPRVSRFSMYSTDLH